ncbi:MAG: hypothetical protein WCW27_03900 [Patescibacteria group bacterium]|jgi:hypothetical protein
MNNTAKILMAVGIVAALGLGATAYAYQGDITQHGPNYTPEREAAMTKAFDNNDYQSWKELMNGRGRVSQVITEQNFAKFVEMRKLQLAGKTTEANAIRTELGLGTGAGQGRGMGKGNHSGNGTCNNAQ